MTTIRQTEISFLHVAVY